MGVKSPLPLPPRRRGAGTHLRPSRRDGSQTARPPRRPHPHTPHVITMKIDPSRAVDVHIATYSVGAGFKPALAPLVYFHPLLPCPRVESLPPRRRGTGGGDPSSSRSPSVIPASEPESSTPHNPHFANMPLPQIPLPCYHPSMNNPDPPLVCPLFLKQVPRLKRIILGTN